MQFAVPSSEVSEQHLGEGVGCGRAHREVRQWGSKPERTQDGRRGWLPKRVALSQAAEQYAVKQYQQYAVEQYQQYVAPVGK